MNFARTCLLQGSVPHGCKEALVPKAYYMLLFVCFCFFVSPIHIWKRHYRRWRATNFDLCSALMAIEQWGFFSVPHIYCDTGHPFKMVISEDPWHSHPFAERLAMKLSLPVPTTKVCRGWDSNTQPSTCGANALTHCATAAVFYAFELILIH